MDYYSVLGLNRNASEKDIKTAYRKLAMQHHPDKGGDGKKFAEINEAYDTLKDPQKRSAYDNPQPQFQFNSANMNDMGGFEDMFAQFGFSRRQPKNKDITIPIKIELQDVFTEKEINIQYRLTTGAIEQATIRIPKFVQNGQTVKFVGLGDNAVQQFPRGDLNVLIQIMRDPYWMIDGAHVRSKETLPLISLLKGTDIIVKTIEGKEIKVNIPRGTKPGTTLNLAGHGLPVNHRQRGNAYIKIDVVMPKLTEDQLMQIENIFGYTNN